MLRFLRSTKCSITCFATNPNTLLTELCHHDSLRRLMVTSIIDREPFLFMINFGYHLLPFILNDIFSVFFADSVFELYSLPASTSV